MKLFNIEADRIQSILLTDLQWYGVVPGTLKSDSWIEFEADGRNGIICTDLNNVLAINKIKD